MRNSFLVTLFLLGFSQVSAENETPSGSPSSQHRETLKDWSGIKATIAAATTPADFIQGFSDLRKITYTTTNEVTPSCHFQLGWTEPQRQEYAAWAKQKWTDWWDQTGSMIELNRKTKAKVYPNAWKAANELTRSQVDLDPIPPVWIPNEWTMVLTFSTGDYSGQEKERWILQRSEQESRVYRITANVWNMRPILLERCIDMTPDDLEHFIAVVSYIFEYELRNPKVEKPRKMEGQPSGYYYPNGLVKLDSGQHSIWHLKGYDHYIYPFQYHLQAQGAGQHWKSGQKAGLARSVAKTMFDDQKTWKPVLQLGPLGRDMIRKSLQDPVFEQVEGDLYRFSVLAASGGKKEAELIRGAIEHANKIESDAMTYRDLVTKDGFTSPKNKWGLTLGRHKWQAMLDYLKSHPSEHSPVVEDLIYEGDIQKEKRFQFIEFQSEDAKKRSQPGPTIRIGINGGR